MHLQHLAVERDSGLVRLRLSGRPLGQREAMELAATATDLLEDRSVRLVVIESAGPDFCPGPAADLDPLLVDPTEVLSRLRPPVVAHVVGRASSVGCELALAADVLVAGPDGRLILSDVTEGRLPCWGGTQRLVRAVGRPRALEVLLLGAEMRGDELGAMTSLDDVVQTLLARAPVALELAKEAIERGAEMPMRDGLRLEGDLNHLLQTTADRAEGLAAFFEKRPARFEGQ